MITISEALHRLLAVSCPQMQGKVFTQCRPALQRAAANSRMVTVRAVASQAHNPNAVTKKVFMDMEIGGNKAGACRRQSFHEGTAFLNQRLWRTIHGTRDLPKNGQADHRLAQNGSPKCT